MPATDIRFVLRVPAEIFGRLREFSKATGLSMNRIICDRLGGFHGDEQGSAEAGKVNGDERVQRKGRGKAGPAPEHRGKSSGRCTLHGKAMKDFGTKWVCEGPPQHSEEK